MQIVRFKVKCSRNKMSLCIDMLFHQSSKKLKLFSVWDFRLNFEIEFYRFVNVDSPLQKRELWRLPGEMNVCNSFAVAHLGWRRKCKPTLTWGRIYFPSQDIVLKISNTKRNEWNMSSNKTATARNILRKNKFNEIFSIKFLLSDEIILSYLFTPPSSYSPGAHKTKLPVFSSEILTAEFSCLSADVKLGEF